MVRYLKARGAYVLFNTNGTVLTPKKGRELCDTGLDELRVSLDAADARTFLLVRGKDYFNRIVRNVRAFTEMQRREGLRPPARLAVADRPQGDHRPASRFRAHRPRDRREGGLPAAARVLRGRRHRHGAPGPGPVRAPDAGGAAASRCGDRAGAVARHQLQRLRRHRARREPGAQGRHEPLVAVPPSLGGDVLHRQRAGAALLHRAVLAARLRELHARRCHAGRRLREIWNGPAYQEFRAALHSDAPPKSCASCGLRWSL